MTNSQLCYFCLTTKCRSEQLKNNQSPGCSKIPYELNNPELLNILETDQTTNPVEILTNKKKSRHQPHRRMKPTRSRRKKLRTPNQKKSLKKIQITRNLKKSRTTRDSKKYKKRKQRMKQQIWTTSSKE